MKRIVSGMMMATALAAGAASTITGVTAAQNPRTGQVEIFYDLAGDDAIVTLDDILMDGVSIGPSNVTTVVGHVARKVRSGNGRVIYWNPRKDIPGRELAGTLTAKLTAWPTNNPPDFMMVRLDVANATNYNNVFWYSSASCLPDGGLTNPVYRLSRYVMRRIPAKNVVWRMGVSSVSDTGAAGDQNQYMRGAPHYVKLTADYYMGIYPVTYGHHRAITGSVPQASPSGSDETPLSTVQNKINYARLRGSGTTWPVDGHTLAAGAILQTYRTVMGVEVDLPTDAQWEFAARAGTSQRYGVNGGTDNFGSTAAPIIWCSTTLPSDQRNYPKPPGLLQPNAWGLYDMNGNAWEWCLDQYDGTWNSETDNWYANAWNQQTEMYNGVTVYVDPVGMLLNTGANTDKNRVLRGGSVGNGANNALSSYRHMQAYDVNTTNHSWGGFRLACPVPTL